MMVSEKMLQIQRDREDADRNWREAEAETQRKWQARESQLSEERHRETIRVAVSANRGNIWSNALPGILGALATILAVYLGAYLATKNSSATTMPSQSAPIEQGSDWNASK